MYDAVVVGARCAGSPTAMLLARKGYRVLLVDRAAFPSDSIRNHFIQHSGIAQLNRWGLLPTVITSNCPPIRDFTTDLGDFPLRVPVEQGDGVDANYAPRRVVLDKILVDAAVAAGVELRERFTVHGLLWDDHRVVGIRGRANGGQMVSEHASIVIGADGVHSVVARAVEAPQYSERPALTYAYYSYFSDVPVDGVEIWLRSWGPYINFPTNDGLTCVAIQAPVAGFHAFRSDIEGNFYQALDAVPELAERVRAGSRKERWYGTADLANFLRKPLDRVGRSSVMLDTTRTRSWRKESATRSATPNCSRMRSTRGSRVSRRWTTRCAPTRNGATRRRSQATSRTAPLPSSCRRHQRFSRNALHSVPRRERGRSGVPGLKDR